MDFYKKIIRSQKLRLSILRFLSFIPDKTMIKLQYRIKTGNKLNLANPKKYTEKLQWYKLYYHNPIMNQCADKYEVRQYVKDQNQEEILNDLYGVWENAEEIDFNKLPEQFVLKTTNGSHTNIFCYDKKQLDKKETISKLNNWLKSHDEKSGREWAYYHIKPRIICEKLLPKDENNDLPDYKFFCFNGKAYYLYVINGRQEGEKVNLGIFDMEYQKLDYYRLDEKKMIKLPKKPENFEKMIKIAEKLSEGFPHVRVDLYNVNGKIYFGELTFYDGSGYQKYDPDEFDTMLGNLFVLPEKLI